VEGAWLCRWCYDRDDTIKVGLGELRTRTGKMVGTVKLANARAEDMERILGLR
jgi:hypothetical protein